MKIARKTYEASVPSMAMGDIAFLLLIFFFILAKASDDSHVDYRPAEALKLENVNQPKVSLAVDKDQLVFLNGMEVTDIEGLNDTIANYLGDAEAGKRIVHLKVDREAPAEVFEPVIEAISMAGGDLVHVLNPADDESQN